MSFPAKYPGKCSRCAKPIAVGTLIEWDRLSKTAKHVRCDDPLAPQREAAQAIEASRASTIEQAPAEVAAVATSIPCPEGLDYLPYQRLGIAQMLARPSTLLADEMGLGKTVQALGVMNADPSVSRAIVVCPASLRLNWAREAARWLCRPTLIGVLSGKLPVNLSNALLGTQTFLADPHVGNQRLQEGGDVSGRRWLDDVARLGDFVLVLRTPSRAPGRHLQATGLGEPLHEPSVGVGNASRPILVDGPGSLVVGPDVPDVPFSIKQTSDVGQGYRVGGHDDRSSAVTPRNPEAAPLHVLGEGHIVDTDGASHSEHRLSADDSHDCLLNDFLVQLLPHAAQHTDLLLVINYDVLGSWLSFLKSLNARLIVVDESQYCKNPKAQRTKAVADLVVTRSHRAVAMTGTPIQNRPIEAYPVLHMLDPKTWPSFFAFARRYCDAKQISVGWGKTAWDFTGASNLNELQDKLRSTVMVRRRKADVLTELPPKRRQVVTIPVDDAGVLRAVRAELEAWEGREERLDALRAEVELSKASDNPDDYRDACAKLQEALQVAFEEISRVRAETAKAKAPFVAEHVADLLDTLPKVVVMAHHHAVVDILMERLKNFGAVKLDGTMPMEQRQSNVERFQSDPSCRLFVGSIQAAGVGITLTASSTVVFAELDWVPGNVTQAEDRCHRIGQKDSVLIQHVVLDGSLDVRMVEVLLSKQAIADAALDDVRAAAEPATPAKERAATEGTSPKALEDEAPSFTTDQVEAIHEGLRTLAGLDTDGARLRNDMGYSKIDVRIGHSLARAPWLSKKQAALGLRLVHKYRRQLGQELLDRAKGLSPAVQ